VTILGPGLKGAGGARGKRYKVVRSESKVIEMRMARMCGLYLVVRASGEERDEGDWKNGRSKAGRRAIIEMIRILVWVAIRSSPTKNV